MKKIIIGLGLFISLSAQAQDSFFTGFANACSLSKQYQSFQENLCKFNTKDGVEVCKFGKITLPEKYNNLVKGHKITNNGDHTLFEIALNKGAVFAGNNIIAIEQWSGHSNGIFGTALLLEESDMKKVKQNITNSHTVFVKKNDEMLGEIGADITKGKDGKIRIVCDFSN